MLNKFREMTSLKVDIVGSGCGEGLEAAVPGGQIPDYYYQTPTSRRDASNRIMHRSAAAETQPHNVQNRQFLNKMRLNSTLRDGVVFTAPPPPHSRRMGCVTLGTGYRTFGESPQYINEGTDCSFFPGEYFGCPNKKCGNIEGYAQTLRCRQNRCTNYSALLSGGNTYDNSVISSCEGRCGGGVHRTSYKPPQQEQPSTPVYTANVRCGCACGPPVDFDGYGQKPVYGWYSDTEGYASPPQNSLTSRIAQGNIREEGGPYRITDTTSQVLGETIVKKPPYLSGMFEGYTPKELALGRPAFPSSYEMEYLKTRVKKPRYHPDYVIKNIPSEELTLGRPATPSSQAVISKIMEYLNSFNHPDQIQIINEILAKLLNPNSTSLSLESPSSRAVNFVHNYIAELAPETQAAVVNDVIKSFSKKIEGYCGGRRHY